MKVYCWRTSNGVWVATRKNITSCRNNPLGYGCNAYAAYRNYVDQIIHG